VRQDLPSSLPRAQGLVASNLGGKWLQKEGTAETVKRQEPEGPPLAAQVRGQLGIFVLEVLSHYVAQAEVRLKLVILLPQPKC
jgi:hypothetical protein